MYRVTDNPCFIVPAVVAFIDLCLVCFAHFLDVVYTLYTHGISAKQTRDRVILSI